MIDTATLRAMIGADGAVALAPPVCVDDALFPEEIAYLAEAAEVRRAEFGTARVCARRALAELGIAPMPLVPNADRSPVWPRGVRGSIAHGSGWCAAAVTSAPDILGLGLDIEDSSSLAPALESLVCTDVERAWLDRRPATERGTLAKLIFCAKEAVYKSQFPLTGDWLDFHDVIIRLEPAAGTFSVVDLHSPSLHRAKLMAAKGWFVQAAGTLLTIAIITD